ncbi:MAG: leucyl/phenylalanyl-tRNA--protein transferase [Geminicoccaceae bacterium]|nr:leucyl/phenylalanyl-tRNA--protein transferase [Geminicoccaceae bacterium]
MKVMTPELVLSAYSIGLFPMANDRDDPTIHWIDPIRRGIIPLNRFHIPRRLAKTIRQRRFEITVDTAFGEVIRCCAEPTDERPRTWLNDEMIGVYELLAARGHGHSVEAWQDGRLVGGLYGLAVGGAFFGESMFSRERDASKVALVELASRLRTSGFVLLDTQFVTSHLRNFGAIEISRQAYRLRLQRAVAVRTRFPRATYSFAFAAAGGTTGPAGASTTGMSAPDDSPVTAASPQSITQTS